MATIWIWNAIASRRRSSSDTFVENGLGVLSAAVEKAGHRVRVIDWARNDFYRTLTPRWVAWLSRNLVTALMDRSNGRRGFGFKALGALNLLVQQAMAWVQRRRMASSLARLADDVAHSGIRIFGMKVWYGEAFFWAKYLAHEIRKLSPEVVLVAGGYHATLYEEDLLKNSPFDLAVISEGEAALSKILDVISASPARREERSFTEDNKGAAQRGGLRSGLRYLLLKILPATKSAKIRTKRESTSFASLEREALLARIREAIAQGSLTNVVYRDGDDIKKTGKTAGDINAKSMSVYGDMGGKVRLHVLIESSGCPWGKCRFCVHHHLEPEYLRRKVDKIVEEIRVMRAQGIGLFRFAGSDTPPEFGSAIAQSILDSGMRVEYAMGSRAVRGAKHPEVFSDLVEKYSLMIRSGLRAVFIGGETGHDVINEKVMNKGLGREDLLWTIRALRDAERRIGTHVDISLAMIYPTPLVDGITDEEVMAQNLSLIASARPDSVMVSPPGPFKNSEWFHNRAQFGFVFDNAVIGQAMEYEYVLYKPLELWSNLDYELGGKGFKDILRACGKMRQAVEDIGVSTDLSDEHFLMMRACGYEGAEGTRAFKQETLADIVSCHYSRLESLCARVNEYSRDLAAEFARARPGRLPAAHPCTVPAVAPTIQWRTSA